MVTMEWWIIHGVNIAAEWSEWSSASTYLWIYTWRLAQVSVCSCTWQGGIYALRIKTRDNILNSIQSTKNSETNCKGTLQDGVAQEFAIQYVSSVTHGDLARVTLAAPGPYLCNVEWQFREWKRRAPDPRHGAIDPRPAEMLLRPITQDLFKIGSRSICLHQSNSCLLRTVPNKVICNDPLNHPGKARPWF